MKPVSIVFLIISAVLIITGIILCCVGMLQAKSEGIQLYDSENEDGELESIYDFSADDISKIEINVDDADVRVVCGAETNVMVIKNFSSVSYVCQVENKALVMDSGFKIDPIDLAQGELHFKGFRYYIRSLFEKNKNSDEKSVTVYISDAFDIKVFDINAGDGNVVIEGYRNDSDYDINVGNGDITLSKIDTGSTLKASITGSGSISATDINAKLISLSCATGNIDLRAAFTELSASTGAGYVSVKSENDLELFNYDLTGDVEITLAGNKTVSPYHAYNPNLVNIIKIDARGGEINVSNAVPFITPVGEDTSSANTNNAAA